MSVSVRRFELENGGVGPSPFRLDQVLADEDVDALVLVLLRDYHCPKCRQQVQQIASRYDEFEADRALVAAVLPETTDRVRKWQDTYDLPYPLLADPDTALADDLDQPIRFLASSVISTT